MEYLLRIIEIQFLQDLYKVHTYSQKNIRMSSVSIRETNVAERNVNQVRARALGFSISTVERQVAR